MSNTHLTGYPSIDKPWLKYYSEEAITAPLPEYTLYEYIYRLNQDNLNKIALNYYGTTTTYRELFHNVSIVAGALERCGVKAGDIVTVCMINSPEAIELIFALSKIGAIAQSIYGVSTEQEILKYIWDSKADVVITLDIFQKKFENIINDITVSKIIVVSTENAMNPEDKGAKKILSNVPYVALPNDGRFLSWEKFLDGALPTKTIMHDPYRAAVITYTGGTTGGSKGVIQSSFGLISNTYQYCKMNIDIKKEHTWLLVFPLFIGFGLFSLLIPLQMGMTVIIRQPMAESIADICREFRPNHIVYGPAFWEAFADENADLDLSYLIEPMTGGDILLPNVEKKINQYLNSHKSNYNIMNGYGMSELGPGISIQCKEVFEAGSVGIPFVKNIASVFDVDTGKELTYGIQGEICICAPSMMMGYLGNQEETNNIIKQHNDGLLWVHTGDLGYISENGFIHISGRLKRYMLSIANGVQKKVFSLDIEKILVQHPAIEKCVVVPVEDETVNQAPVAFIVLRSEEILCDELKNDIQQFAVEHLDSVYCPVRYYFVENIPLSKVGKVDYRALEKEAKNMMAPK